MRSRRGRAVVVGCSGDTEPTAGSTGVRGGFADELSADVFTVDRSCGYDFVTGDESGSWLLVIGNGFGELTPGRHEVSLVDVYGSVTVGEDLWANHCSDVVLPSSPVPAPADEWRIVEGSFVMPDVLESRDRRSRLRSTISSLRRIKDRSRSNRSRSPMILTGSDRAEVASPAPVAGHQGYADHGEEWQALQRRQPC